MEATIINQTISVVITLVVAYLGFINTLRTKVAVLEDNVEELQKKCKEATDKFDEMAHNNSVLQEKVKHLESRQDSHSKKNDEVINLITEFKLEMIKKIGDVNTQMGKISSDVENINNTIAIFDDCVVSRGNKKKNKK